MLLRNKIQALSKQTILLFSLIIQMYHKIIIYAIPFLRNFFIFVLLKCNISNI